MILVRFNGDKGCRGNRDLGGCGRAGVQGV